MFCKQGSLEKFAITILCRREGGGLKVLVPKVPTFPFFWTENQGKHDSALFRPDDPFHFPSDMWKVSRGNAQHGKKGTLLQYRIGSFCQSHFSVHTSIPLNCLQLLLFLSLIISSFIFHSLSLFFSTSSSQKIKLLENPKLTNTARSPTQR